MLSVFQRLRVRFSKSKPAPITVQVVQRDVCRLTLAEWRQIPDYVKVSQKFLADPGFRMMLDVCRNEHPSTLVFPVDVSSEARSVQLGRIEGYMMCLNNLELMGKIEKPQEQLEATFEDPQKEQQQE